MRKISQADFEHAMDNWGALREAIEARIAQTTYVEALYLDVPGHDHHIFVAIHDNPNHHDFSVWDEMRAELQPRAFYSTNDLVDLNTFLGKLIFQENSDDSI